MNNDNSSNIELQEHYKDYTPPLNVSKVFRRLISGVPNERLVGLKYIILKNSKALNHKDRRRKTWSRKRKVTLSKCYGWYSEKWEGRPAHIEIIVDNILEPWPRALLYFSFFKDLLFADTLFHEIGHHIHKTQAPEYREREDVAEKWSRILSRQYFRKRYWYIMVLLWPFKALIDLKNKYVIKKQTNKQVEQRAAK